MCHEPQHGLGGSTDHEHKPGISTQTSGKKDLDGLGSECNPGVLCEIPK